jgi:hypothetical protein
MRSNQTLQHFLTPTLSDHEILLAFWFRIRIDRVAPANLRLVA